MKFGKAMAIILSVIMFATGTTVGAYAADGVDYTINNTYADVSI